MTLRSVPFRPVEDFAFLDEKTDLVARDRGVGFFLLLNHDNGAKRLAFPFVGQKTVYIGRARD